MAVCFAYCIYLVVAEWNAKRVIYKAMLVRLYLLCLFHLNWRREGSIEFHTGSYLCSCGSQDSVPGGLFNERAMQFAFIWLGWA